MALVSAVKVRFPELTELAQQTVVQINDTTGLDMLLKHVITAPMSGLRVGCLVQLRNSNQGNVSILAGSVEIH